MPRAGARAYVAPLSSSTLDTLTHEAASTADRPSRNATPSLLSEGDQALVLIVDDDPITRQMVANLLAFLGLDALEAEDGLEALEHC